MTLDIGIIANIAQIVSVIVPALGLVYSVYRRIDKKQQQFESELKLVAQKLNFIVNQFGPNGGGLREKVNEIGDRLHIIEQRQITIGDRVAKLDGEFEQHIKESE